MTKNPVHDIETKYIRQIQRQQLELALVKAERDAALREREIAQARSQAMGTLVEALSGSLRPFGFDRKRFLAAIRRAARSVPDHGPAALQHTVLFEGSNRVLGRIAAPLSSARLTLATVRAADQTPSQAGAEDHGCRTPDDI